MIKTAIKDNAILVLNILKNEYLFISPMFSLGYITFTLSPTFKYLNSSSSIFLSFSLNSFSENKYPGFKNQKCSKVPLSYFL